ncbi:hypothetical protein [Fuscovulum blasticum]|uniref:hypothetical protein n=1 Tax=Fuscovulum blasticum TaxID=1075 RepID=UPI000F5017DA|nr:hypothetical protein [Fuscovulum blasticum]
MAKISAKWNCVRVPACDTVSWRSTKAWLEKADAKIGDHSIYVIRTTKPFAISYEKKASPVLYIGEGNFSERLRSHIKNWIYPLARDLPNLTVEIYFAEIRVKNNPTAHRDVEADLIWEFSDRFGSVPLMNRQFEYHDRYHSYERGFFKPIQSERGKGYLWAMRPLISNMAYPASLKGALI